MFILLVNYFLTTIISKYENTVLYSLKFHIFKYSIVSIKHKELYPVLRNEMVLTDLPIPDYSDSALHRSGHILSIIHYIIKQF